ncbi:MAG: VOC family protein [Roseibium sp.]|uniref:VOC family protein n=1 Tax=Roseibium sp. TaxID=1936156 RepID=UPI002636C786|nr:VOC family protein [Roseibium sp.]MCV0427204.1 VOC family protein [Roseibium sp.]
MSDETSRRFRLGRVAAMIAVSDIERSLEIYRSVFGFEKVFENGNPVGFMILKKDDAELHLSLQKDYKAPSFNVAHMLVSDAEAAYRACEEHGLRIIKSLKTKDYGLKAFVIADPDGNRIDVGQPV